MKVNKNIIFFIILFGSSIAFSQDTGGHLCGSPPGENTVYCILRFEVLDKETHTPVRGATIRITGNQRAPENKWQVNRLGIGVLVATDQRCFDEESLVEVTHPDYGFEKISISKLDLKQAEMTRRIYLEGHNHNWTFLNALPSMNELIDKIGRRRYSVGVNQVPLAPGVPGVMSPNYAPPVLEYTIEMTRIAER